MYVNSEAPCSYVASAPSRFPARNCAFPFSRNRAASARRCSWDRLILCVPWGGSNEPPRAPRQPRRPSARPSRRASDRRSTKGKTIKTTRLLMRRREVDATFRRLTSVDHAVFWQTRVSSFTIRTTRAAAPLLGQLAAKHAADGPAAARAPVRVSLGLRRLGRARHAAVAVQQVAAGHHERVPPLDVANLARDRVPRVLRRRVRVCHRASRRGERFRELRRAHHGSAVHDDRFVPSRVDALSGRTLWTGGTAGVARRDVQGRRRRGADSGESSSGSEETSPSSDGGISRVASATRDARARRERSPLAPLVPGTRRCPAAPGGRVAKKCSASSSVRSTPRGARRLASRRERVLGLGVGFVERGSSRV